MQISGSCSLCKKKDNLQESHIIPKFIFKWIKNTSGTGFMANADDSSKRIQDGMKMHLLCKNCEEQFSKFENYFAKQIFLPFHNEKLRSFEYNSNLKLFVVSLSWRSLMVCRNSFQSELPNYNSLLDQAEVEWRQFLLGKQETISYECHLRFLDYIRNQINLHPKFNSYTLRSTDATLVGNSKRILSYVKLPWMIFLTSIHPINLENWSGTLIKKHGKIDASIQSDSDVGFNKFLSDRINNIFDKSGPSMETIKTRLERANKKDPTRFLESASFQAMIAEGDLQRRRNMEDMPKTLIGIIDEIIVPVADDPNRTNAKNQAYRYVARQFADLITKLSNSDSIKLDKMIRRTMNESKQKKRETQSIFQSEIICVIFIVNHNATKDYQWAKIENEIKKVKERQLDHKTPIAAFSMNVENDGISFESGFVYPNLT